MLDDGFDQQTAISDYTRLISQDKVDLVLGTFSSDLNLAVAPIAERYKYVYVEPSGGADEIFERGFKYLFFAQPATTQKLPDQFVDLIEALPEARAPETTVALVQLDDPNTTQAAELFEERLGALGVETVYDETYAPDTIELRRHRQRHQAGRPRPRHQRLASPATGSRSIRSFQKVGFSPGDALPAQHADRPGVPGGDRRGQHRGHLHLPRLQPEATYPGNAEFVEGYTEQFGAPPSEDAANSYTAGQVLAAAVEAVGELDQTAIAEWLHANTVETIVGPLSWDESGPAPGRDAARPVPGRCNCGSWLRRTQRRPTTSVVKPDWQ